VEFKVILIIKKGCPRITSRTAPLDLLQNKQQRNGASISNYQQTTLYLSAWLSNRKALAKPFFHTALALLLVALFK